MAKRAELQAMVRTLGCPDLFVTFSAADLHWDSFFANLPEYTEWKFKALDWLRRSNQIVPL